MTGTRIDEPSAARRGINRLIALRAGVRRRPGGWVAWRIGVTIAGVAIIVGGVILLPLPGPGWLIIFAGLGVLGTEYEWANRLLGWVRAQLGRWSVWVAGRPRWAQTLIGAAGLIFLAVVAYLAWTIYR